MQTFDKYVAECQDRSAQLFMMVRGAPQQTAEQQVITSPTQDELAIENFYKDNKTIVSDYADEFYNVLKTFSNYFIFVSINRDKAFENEYRNNEDIFKTLNIKDTITPIGISSIRYKGHPTILYYTLQKVLTRLVAVEYSQYAKEEADDMGDFALGSTQGNSKFKYTKPTLFDIEFNMGDFGVISDVFSICDKGAIINKDEKTIENISSDNVFLMVVDNELNKISAYGKFNEMIMVPVLQHYDTYFAQTGASSIGALVK